MRIVQLANFYGPRSGGLRVAVDELARHYVVAGHQCTLVIPGDADSVEINGRRTVVRIRSPLVPGLGGYRMIVDRRKVREAVDHAEPDIVELSDKATLAGGAAGIGRRGVPTVLISHERLEAVIGSVFGDAVASHPVVRSGLDRYNMQLGARVDAIVCASDFAAAEFTRYSTPVRRIPLGVDLDVFRPAASPVARGVPVRLVSAVRLSPEKRPRLVVDAIRCLVDRGVDVRAVLFGDGPLRDRLRRAARDLPIEFAGHVSDRQMLAREVGRADVAIAPGPHETFGLAALEALACGTPVVVPDSGALRELVVDGVGVVARPEPTSFADGVETLLRGDRARQGAAARERAERFGWDSSARSFLDLYHALIGRTAMPTRHRSDAVIPP